MAARAFAVPALLCLLPLLLLPRYSTAPRGCVDVPQALRDATASEAFSLPGYYVWGSSAVRGEDGLYHLFASRWPDSTGPNGWVVACEIVRAVSASAEGPYSYVETVLGRGAGWDGLSAHNPTIHWDAASRRYALFYIGTRAADEGAPSTSTSAPPSRADYESAWNSKRIGLATAASVAGPWQRQAAPILQPRSGEWDAAITSNPAAWIHRNGSVLLLYKSIRLGYPERHRVKPHPSFHLGAAFAPSIDGPFRRLSSSPILHWAAGEKPVLNRGRPLAAEDPYVWRYGGRYHLIFKAMQPLRRSGLRSGDLAYTSSADLRRWEPPVHAINRTLHWRSDATSPREPSPRFQTVARLERPQLLLEGGQPTHVFCGMAPSRSGDVARNVVLTLPGTAGSFPFGEAGKGGSVQAAAVQPFHNLPRVGGSVTSFDAYGRTRSGGGGRRRHT